MLNLACIVWEWARKVSKAPIWTVAYGTFLCAMGWISSHLFSAVFPASAIYFTVFFSFFLNGRVFFPPAHSTQPPPPRGAQPSAEEDLWTTGIDDPPTAGGGPWTWCIAFSKTFSGDAIACNYFLLFSLHLQKFPHSGCHLLIFSCQGFFICPNSPANPPITLGFNADNSVFDAIILVCLNVWVNQEWAHNEMGFYKSNLR